MALRATCPSAAVMVKGIQSEVMVNMGEVIPAGGSGHRAGRGRCGQLKPPHDRIALCFLSPEAGRGETYISSATTM
jgi:hypothetical protein